MGDSTQSSCSSAASNDKLAPNQDPTTPQTPSLNGYSSISSRKRPTYGDNTAPSVSPKAHRTISNGSIHQRSAPTSSSRTLAPRARRSAVRATPSVGLYDRIERLSQFLQISLKRQFRRHGRRVARHPVQTLLLTCLIVTSLFYPAVGIFLWSSKGGPGVTRGDARSVWRSLSTPLLDSFASSGRKHHNSLRDLRMIWDDAPDLRAYDARDADAWERLHERSTSGGGGDKETATTTTTTKCRAIRLEHVFITTDDVTVGLGPRFGSLHTPVLRSALNLQRSIQAALLSDHRNTSQPRVPECIRDANDQCLILSPLSFWQTDKDRILQDNTPTDTVLQSDLNTTEQGVPLSLSTTLAGRSHLFKQLPRADHLALTFFLEDEEGCKKESQNKPDREKDQNPSHQAWTSLLQGITGRQVNLLSSDWKLPKELVLHFAPKHPEESLPTQKLFLIAAYAAMIVWLTRGLFTLRNVHFPLGMAFTACVELTISMTLAISICALVGVRLTLIPWEILPFVIVVIGSENMFALTNAMISTPASLNVASRMATGFDRVGVSIAVTVASDVFLMSLISFFVSVPAVREFCIFAIFALIVDFFMQMSMYATVLSIDMQRFELADLLSQDYREIANHDTGRDDDSNHSGTGSDTGSKDLLRGTTSLFTTSCRTVWRARTARTASLSLLIAFMTGLYLYHGTGYASSLTYPHQLSVHEEQHASQFSSLQRASDTFSPSLTADASKEDASLRFDPYAHLSSDDMRSVRSSLPWWYASPSAQLWKTLNPSDAAMLRVKVEPWTVVSLPSAMQRVRTRSFASWALFRPRVRAIIWFSKLVVLPIAGTTTLLWLLLLYLLKDTELLDAQRNRTAGQQNDDGGTLASDEEAQKDVSRAVQLSISLTACGEAHDSDIHLVVQSGVFVVTVATDSTLQVSRVSKKASKTSSVVLNTMSSPYSTPCAVAVDTTNDLIGLGHPDGAITLLSLSTLKLVESIVQCRNDDQRVNRVVHLKFADASTLLMSRGHATLFAFYANGSAWCWRQGAEGAMQQLAKPTTGPLLSVTFDVAKGLALEHNVVLNACSDGSFTIYALDGNSAQMRALTSSTRGEGLAKCAAMTDGFIFIGTASGRLAVYDTETGQQRQTCDLSKYGPISTVRSVSCDKDETVVVVVSLRRVTVLMLNDPLTTLRSNLDGSALERLASHNELRRDLSEDSISDSLIPQSSSDMTAHQAQLSSPGAVVRNPRRASHSRPLKGRQPSFESSFRSLDRPSPPLPLADRTPPAKDGMVVIASFDCMYGGADVVLSRKGLSLIGVRRRTEATRAVKVARDQQDVSNRWEVFAFDLARQVAGSTGLTALHDQLVDVNDNGEGEQQVSRVALPLEDGATFSVADGRTNAGVRQGQMGGAFTSSSASWEAVFHNSFSFTRFERVQAFYKHDDAQRLRLKDKRSLLLMFGNTVAIVNVEKEHE